MMFHVFLSYLLSFTTRGVLCDDAATAGDLEFYANRFVNRVSKEFESMLDDWMQQSVNTAEIPQAAPQTPNAPTEIVVDVPTTSLNTTTYVFANSSVQNIDPAAILSNENIYQFFNKMRVFIQDPLPLPDKSRLRNLPDYIVMFGAIKESKIDGLSKYNIANIQVNTSALTMSNTFSWDNVYLNGEYELDVNGPKIHVYGKGPYRLNVTGMLLSTNVSLKECENKSLSLESFQVDFRIANVSMKLENFMDGGAAGDVANSLISELIPEALSFIMPQFKSIIEKKTISYVNMFLSTMNIQHISNFIQSYFAA